MTSQEILQKAIQKAIDGGWDMFKHRKETVPPWYIVKGGQMPTPQVVEDWVPADSLMICGAMNFYFVWEHTIFNHDFAKALWGEATIDGYLDIVGQKMNKDFSRFKPWQYHLQRMVVADNPIKYLGDNI